MHNVRFGGNTPRTESYMEHTLRATRITVAPVGVFMTASEANRQRVLTLLLAEHEQLCTSVWAVIEGPVDVVSRVPIGWSPIPPQPENGIRDSLTVIHPGQERSKVPQVRVPQVSILGPGNA
jgi:hypothetical protein